MFVLTADLIFTPGKMLSGYALVVEENGQIKELRPLRAGESVSAYQGVLCPGFVNTHCHLELSAFRGQVPEGLGMKGFVSHMVQQRGNFTEEQQKRAVFDALREAYFTGTMVMGDICNHAGTAEMKKGFPELYCHNFIELLGLDGSKAADILKKGRSCQEKFAPLPSSLTLHAPYSVSPELRNLLAQSPPDLLTIHLLESEAEVEIFAEKSGPLLEFYKELNLPYSPFPDVSPEEYILEGLSADQALLLVHNRLMDAELLTRLIERFSNAWFCLCPLSNVYIHQELPRLGGFYDHAERLCIGTDSLASNRSLRLLDELKLLQQIYPLFSLHQLLRMATIQGAEALQVSHKFGSFIPGSACGVNLIEQIELRDQRLTSASAVRKLF